MRTHEYFYTFLYYLSFPISGSPAVITLFLRSMVCYTGGLHSSAADLQNAPAFQTLAMSGGSILSAWMLIHTVYLGVGPSFSFRTRIQVAVVWAIAYILLPVIALDTGWNYILIPGIVGFWVIVLGLCGLRCLVYAVKQDGRYAVTSSRWIHLQFIICGIIGLSELGGVILSMIHYQNLHHIPPIWSTFTWLVQLLSHYPAGRIASADCYGRLSCYSA